MNGRTVQLGAPVAKRVWVARPSGGFGCSGGGSKNPQGSKGLAAGLRGLNHHRASAAAAFHEYTTAVICRSIAASGGSAPPRINWKVE